MMFDWVEYLYLARELAARNEEASQRSAISRAYYAAFCSARNWLSHRGMPIPPTSDAHTFVWQAFEMQADRPKRAVGQLGRRLRRARTQADYEDHMKELRKTVEDALCEAQKVLTIIIGTS